MTKKYNPREEIVNWFEWNILYSDEKVKNLSKNLFHKSNFSETNALTVGIVWAWWIGKTSFMNLLLNYLYEKEKEKGKLEKEKLEKDVSFDEIINTNWLNKLSEDYYVIKINSWLLEKSDLQSEYMIVDYILGEIAEKDPDMNSRIKKIIKKLKNIDVEIGIPFLKVWMKGNSFISTRAIDNFVNEFKSTVNKFLWDKKKKEQEQEQEKKRIILIIDDLDRIPPKDAVSMMDSIKLFLDDWHFIVFFLNDKRIIKEWLKEKFWDEIWDKIANEYLDKLMQIDIKLKKYLDTEDYEKWIKNFIQEHPYIKLKVPNLIGELEKEENKKLLETILDLWNFRKVKKLFRNLQVQWPSLFKDNSDKGRLKSVIEYLKEELLEKDDKNSNLE